MPTCHYRTVVLVCETFSGGFFERVSVYENVVNRCILSLKVDFPVLIQLKSFLYIFQICLG